MIEKPAHSHRRKQDKGQKGVVSNHKKEKMEIAPKCAIGNGYIACGILHDYENEWILEHVNRDYRRLHKEWFQIGAIFKAGETKGCIIWEYTQKWSNSGWSCFWMEGRNVTQEGTQPASEGLVIFCFVTYFTTIFKATWMHYIDSFRIIR